MNGGTLRPYLKWAGGKRQLLEGIDRFVPPFTEYYEPFVGAGAVLFHLHPGKAVINDSNTQLCITYEAIRDDVDDVIDMLKQHVEGNRLRGAEYFYEVRGLDRDPVAFNNLSKAEKAARTIFLNKTCYNGLYRVNSKGCFNTPYGRYVNPSVYEEDVLRSVSDYLGSNDITILNGDFEDAVDPVGGGGHSYTSTRPTTAPGTRASPATKPAGSAGRTRCASATSWSN